MEIFAVFVIWIVAGIVAGIIASNKNRSAVGWFFLTILLTPLCVFIVMALKPLDTSVSR